MIGFFLMEHFWPISNSSTLDCGFQPHKTLSKCSHDMDQSSRALSLHVQEEKLVRNRRNGGKGHFKENYERLEEKMTNPTRKNLSPETKSVVHTTIAKIDAFGPWMLVERKNMLNVLEKESHFETRDLATKNFGTHEGFKECFNPMFEGESMEAMVELLSVQVSSEPIVVAQDALTPSRFPKFLVAESLVSK
ncbi:hypothetical protein J1N35_010138 [Gossypium stocksii]|uniref:Uncharacterized protein n=1 Tax=Gossypium stocksii TaxID=47602 RepID=A0A9D3W1S0_9ROSI|nr:hypothetical protein J1N35_010138 [Gossypium stocksii]